jgi:exosortase A
MATTDTSAVILSTHPDTQGRNWVTAWIRPLSALAVSVLISLIFFRQTVVSLVTIWNDSRTYSYGFIIVPICALLVVRRKNDLKALQPETSFLGLIFVVCSVLLWLAGNIGDVQLLQQFALVVLIDSLVWTFLGLPIVKVLSFPLFFLFFAIPVGDSLVPHLQTWTADFTVSALNFSGIPTVQDGFVLSTPSGSWQVAAACSGIRYLLASIVIGVLVAGVAYRSWKRRIAFLLLSALLPIGANAVRAYGIVVLAYVSGNTIAVGVDHVVYGFVFFSLLTAFLVLAAMRSYEPEIESPDHTTPPVGLRPPALSGTIAAFCVVVVLSALATAFAHHVWARPSGAVSGNSMRVPAGWSATVDDRDEEWAPHLISVQSKSIRSYASPEEQVSLCVIRYSDDRRGVELVNALNLVGAGGTWTVLSSGTRPATIDGQHFAVAEYVIATGPEHRLVWVWYSVGDTLTSSPYRLRMLQARNRLVGLPNTTMAFAASTPIHGDSDASSVLSGFLK